MKIRHSSGKELKIDPETILEMERANPFFNDYGEQSIPITLPADMQNFQALGFPDNIAGTQKMPNRSDATIQEGVFHIRCRQAILSASVKEGIDTSFYLNIGSFYEKMKDVQLQTIFKDKKIKFQSVSDAMNFVRGLMVTPDKRFSCFPAIVEDNDTNRLVSINRMVTPLKPDGYLSFYNETDRAETVDDKTVSIPAGYYITPFIKVLHVLDLIFQYLGYTLEDSFFSSTEPFKSMVFLNNNIDTIVKGEISYSQVVPDCNVSTILDIFRNRFCCEFIPDETQKTIRIVLFNEILEQKPKYDLTTKITYPISIDHGKSFQQIKLTSDKGALATYNQKAEHVSSTPDFFEKSLYEIEESNPNTLINPAKGIIYREGFRGDSVVVDCIGSLNCDYFAEKELEPEEKESPDVLVTVDFFFESFCNAPFIGDSRAINSTIIWNQTSSDSTEQSTQEKTELKPMLCFTIHRSAMNDIGTIYDSIYNENYQIEKVCDYMLCFNGKNGLFEKFWRKYDDMLRNSFRPVTVQLMLSDTDKMNVSAHEKISIQNQELLPNVIKYNIGKKESTECTFLTTRLYNPTSSAKPESNRFKHRYRWVVKTSASITTEYIYVTYNEAPVVFYPPLPTEAEYLSGGRYYQKEYSVKFNTTSGYTNGTLTVWLEPSLIDI